MPPMLYRRFSAAGPTALEPEHATASFSRRRCSDTPIRVLDRGCEPRWIDEGEHRLMDEQQPGATDRARTRRVAIVAVVIALASMVAAPVGAMAILGERQWAEPRLVSTY